MSDGFFIVGGLACCAAQEVRGLILGRFLSGVGLGISAIGAPVYIAEISPREKRGLNSTMNGVFIAFGILMSIVSGLPQSPPPAGPEQQLDGLDTWFWRVLLGFPAIPAMIQAALFTQVIPLDPPSFLVQQNRIGEARSLIYDTYGFKPPVQGRNKGTAEEAVLETRLQEMIDATAEAQRVPNIHIVQAIFDPFFRCAIFLGLGLAAFQQLCGINALMSYSNSLFKEAGIQPAQLTLASTLMATANVVVSVCSSRVVDRWGRRSLLLLGSFLQTVAMAVLTYYTQDIQNNTSQSILMGVIAVLCFTLFVTSFSAGLGAVTWLYLAEIYPMEIRGPMLSACGIINWMSCFTVVFGARFLSLHGACKLFGYISAVGCIGVWQWVIETKGCSMDDSPLTPRSGRSSSHLLTPTPPSPRTNYKEWDNEDEGEEYAMRVNAQ